jgi:hypothetical protein
MNLVRERIRSTVPRFWLLCAGLVLIAEFSQLMPKLLLDGTIEV